MDLLSSIRKEGSRGGVNFSWSDVTTSQHRENYLGHSIMAPVGRWQKGKDLTWYAKGDTRSDTNGETFEEKQTRERKEEIRRIKEAEEDALSRALGLPVKERNLTGSNAVTLGEVKTAVREVGVGEYQELSTGNAFSKPTNQSQDVQNNLDISDGKFLEKSYDQRCKSRSPRKERKYRQRHRYSRSPESRRRISRSGTECRRYNDKDNAEERRQSHVRKRGHRSISSDRHMKRYLKEDRRKSRRSRSPDLRLERPPKEFITYARR